MTRAYAFETIQHDMIAYGIWNHCDSGRMYTTDEFLTLFGEKMPEHLKKLITEHVTHLQCFFEPPQTQTLAKITG